MFSFGTTRTLILRQHQRVLQVAYTANAVFRVPNRDSACSATVVLPITATATYNDSITPIRQHPDACYTQRRCLASSAAPAVLSDTDDVDNEAEDPTTTTTSEQEEYALWTFPKKDARTVLMEALNVRVDKSRSSVEDSSSSLSTDEDDEPLQQPSVTPEETMLAASQQEEEPPLTVNSSASQQLHDVIERIHLWVRQVNSLEREMKSSAHLTYLPREKLQYLRKRSSTQTTADEAMVAIGKILLSSLAEATQAIPVGEHPRHLNSERAAWKILDVLRVVKKRRLLDDPDLFTSVIQCRRPGSSPLETAKKAEDILQHMISGEQYKEDRSLPKPLPKPNTNTFNALILLWSQVGGTLGRYNDLDEENFRPNRESFLRVLSSCTYTPSNKNGFSNRSGGRFDAEFARQCLQRMSDLARETGDEWMLPDVQAYNAPLRWSGGQEARRSRPYARPLPWDNYSTLFQNGFRDVSIKEREDALLEEARAMQSWMEEDMKTSRIAPNIETYEAVIQAFVRSATRQGLEHAEVLAENLLTPSNNSDVRPRRQTFHPILAAWVYSNDPDGHVKVEQWVRRLEDAASTFPEVAPDGRMISWQITAELSRQQQFLDNLPGTESSDVTEDLRKQAVTVVEGSARSCSKVLEKLIHSVEATLRGDRDPEWILEVTPLLHTVRARSNVAKLSQYTKSCDHVQSSLDEVVKVIDAMECLISTLSAAVAEGEAVKLSAGKLDKAGFASLQLRQLVSYAPHVYSDCLLIIRRLSHISADTPGLDTTAPFLSIQLMTTLERVLLRNAELEKQGLTTSGSGHDAEQPELKNPFYDDLFRYTRPKGLVLTTRDEGFTEAALFLQEMAPQIGPSSDVVRLALLLRDVAHVRTVGAETKREIDTLVGSVCKI